MPLRKFTSGDIGDKGDQVVFDFKAVTEVAEVTGSMVFNFVNDLCSDATVSMTFPTAELAQQVYQNLAQAETNPATIKLDGATISSSSDATDMVGLTKLVLKSFLKMMLSDTHGFGTLESPFSPCEANFSVGVLEKDEVTEQDVYVKGKIASIKYTFSAQYGTATFFISEDGKDDLTFQCYSVYYLGNKPWTDGDTQIEVGDDVIICGKLVNYKGSITTHD